MKKRIHLFFEKLIATIVSCILVIQTIPTNVWAKSDELNDYWKTFDRAYDQNINDFEKLIMYRFEDFQNPDYEYHEYLPDKAYNPYDVIEFINDKNQEKLDEEYNKEVDKYNEQLNQETIDEDFNSSEEKKEERIKEPERKFAKQLVNQTVYYLKANEASEIEIAVLKDLNFNPEYIKLINSEFLDQEIEIEKKETGELYDYYDVKSNNSIDELMILTDDVVDKEGDIIAAKYQGNYARIENYNDFSRQQFERIKNKKDEEEKSSTQEIVSSGEIEKSQEKEQNEEKKEQSKDDEKSNANKNTDAKEKTEVGKRKKRDLNSLGSLGSLGFMNLMANGQDPTETQNYTLEGPTFGSFETSYGLFYGKTFYAPFKASLTEETNENGDPIPVLHINQSIVSGSEKTDSVMAMYVDKPHNIKWITGLRGLRIAYEPGTTHDKYRSPASAAAGAFTYKIYFNEPIKDVEKVTLALSYNYNLKDHKTDSIKTPKTFTIRKKVIPKSTLKVNVTDKTGENLNYTIEYKKVLDKNYLSHAKTGNPTVIENLQAGDYAVKLQNIDLKKYRVTPLTRRVTLEEYGEGLAEFTIEKLEDSTSESSNIIFRLTNADLSGTATLDTPQVSYKDPDGIKRTHRLTKKSNGGFEYILEGAKPGVYSDVTFSILNKGYILENKTPKTFELKKGSQYVSEGTFRRRTSNVPTININIRMTDNSPIPDELLKAMTVKLNDKNVTVNQNGDYSEIKTKASNTANVFIDKALSSKYKLIEATQEDKTTGGVKHTYFNFRIQKITNSSRKNVEVILKDNENNPVTKGEIKIYDSEGYFIDNRVGKLTTGGVAKIGTLPIGKYIAKFEGDEDHLPVSQEFDVKVDSEDPITINLTTTKIDKENSARIRINTFIQKDELKTKLPFIDLEILDEMGQVVQNLKANLNGYAISNYLPKNKSYTVRIKDEKTREFTTPKEEKITLTEQYHDVDFVVTPIKQDEENVPGIVSIQSQAQKQEENYKGLFSVKFTKNESPGSNRRLINYIYFAENEMTEPTDLVLTDQLGNKLPINGKFVYTALVDESGVPLKKVVRDENGEVKSESYLTDDGTITGKVLKGYLLKDERNENDQIYRDYIYTFRTTLNGSENEFDLHAKMHVDNQDITNIIKDYTITNTLSRNDGANVEISLNGTGSYDPNYDNVNYKLQGITKSSVAGRAVYTFYLNNDSGFMDLTQENHPALNVKMTTKDGGAISYSKEIKDGKIVLEMEIPAGYDDEIVIEIDDVQAQKDTKNKLLKLEGKLEFFPTGKEEALATDQKTLTASKIFGLKGDISKASSNCSESNAHTAYLKGVVDESGEFIDWTAEIKNVAENSSELQAAMNFIVGEGLGSPQDIYYNSRGRSFPYIPNVLYDKTKNIHVDSNRFSVEITGANHPISKVEDLFWISNPYTFDQNIMDTMPYMEYFDVPVNVLPAGSVSAGDTLLVTSNRYIKKDPEGRYIFWDPQSGALTSWFVQKTNESTQSLGAGSYLTINFKTPILDKTKSQYVVTAENKTWRDMKKMSNQVAGCVSTNKVVIEKKTYSADEKPCDVNKVDRGFFRTETKYSKDGKSIIWTVTTGINTTDRDKYTTNYPLEITSTIVDEKGNANTNNGLGKITNIKTKVNGIPRDVAFSIGQNISVNGEYSSNDEIEIEFETPITENRNRYYLKTTMHAKDDPVGECTANIEGKVVDLRVNKIWQNLVNDQIVPPITLDIYQLKEDGTISLYKTESFDLSKENPTVGSVRSHDIVIENLPRFDENGAKINYSVEERTLDSFKEDTIPLNSNKTAFQITNVAIEKATQTENPVDYVTDQNGTKPKKEEQTGPDIVNADTTELNKKREFYKIDYEDSTIAKYGKQTDKPGEFDMTLSIEGKGRSTVSNTDITFAIDNTGSMKSSMYDNDYNGVRMPTDVDKRYPAFPRQNNVARPNRNSRRMDFLIDTMQKTMSSLAAKNTTARVGIVNFATRTKPLSKHQNQADETTRVNTPYLELTEVNSTTYNRRIRYSLPLDPWYNGVDKISNPGALTWNQRVEGFTNTQEAIKDAVNNLYKSGPERAKKLVIVTDGEPTVSFKLKWANLNKYLTKGESPAEYVLKRPELINNPEYVLDTSRFHFLPYGSSKLTYTTEDGFVVDNQGIATLLEMNYWKSIHPDMEVFVVMIAPEQQGGDRGYLGKEERAKFNRALSSGNGYYYESNTGLDLADILDEITGANSKNTIIGGKVVDPMGDYVSLKRNFETLKLASTPELKDGDLYIEDNRGFHLENDGDSFRVVGPGRPIESLLLDSTAKPIVPSIRTNSMGKATIELNGLNLGEGQEVRFSYKIKLDTDKEGFKADNWYQNNKTTYLYPKADDPNATDTEREVHRFFPIPSVKGVTTFASFTKIWKDGTGVTNNEIVPENTKVGFDLYRYRIKTDINGDALKTGDEFVMQKDESTREFVNSYVLDGKVDALEENPWTLILDNLPAYDKDGIPYFYEFEENTKLQGFKTDIQTVRTPKMSYSKEKGTTIIENSGFKTEITNTKEEETKIEFKFKKYDATAITDLEKAEKIPGISDAEFELVKYNGSDFEGELKTYLSQNLTGNEIYEALKAKTYQIKKAMVTENGLFETELSESGYYILKETKSPTGYVLDKNLFYVIKVEGETLKMYEGTDDLLNNQEYQNVDKNNTAYYLIPNRRLSELPYTGGEGSNIYILSGSLMMILSYYFFLKRKYAKKAEPGAAKK